MEGVKRNLQYFADGTSMHGFAELFYAKQGFWKFFWTVLVGVAVSMTTYQVYRATEQFVLQTNSITLEQPQSDDVLYPHMSTCFVHWIYWVDWSKGFSMGFTKEAMMYGLSFLSDVYSSNTFDIEEAKSNFTKTMAANSFIRLSQFYLAIAKSFPLVDKDGYLLTNSSYFQSMELTFKSSKSLLCYSINSSTILNSFNAKWDAILDNTWNGYIFNFSVQDQSYSTICKHVTLDEYNHYLASWLSMYSAYWVGPEQLRLNFSTSSLPLYFYPNGFSDNGIQINYENDAYRVKLAVVVRRSTNKKTNSCRENEKMISNNSTCSSLCRAEYFEENCQCRRLGQATLIEKDQVEMLCPKSIFFISTKGSEDDFNNFNDTQFEEQMFNMTKSQFMCQYDETRKRIFYNCVANCELKPCEIWIYTVTSTMSSYDSFTRNNLYKNQTDIFIEYPGYDYISIMVETEKQSVEDFIGSIGGLLGVWTGASVISFFQLFYLCLCPTGETCAIEHKQTKKQTVG